MQGGAKTSGTRQSLQGRVGASHHKMKRMLGARSRAQARDWMQSRRERVWSIAWAVFVCVCVCVCQTQGNIVEGSGDMA